MKQKKIKLTKNAAGEWSYEDGDFEKGCMTIVEVTSMFIARFAATLQNRQNDGERANFEIVVKTW